MICWAITVVFSLALAAAQFPAASQSFAIPSMLTPYVPTNPPQYMAPEAKPITISRVWDWLRMSDWASEYDIYRDGGGACSLYNRTFWVFCDTSAYSKTTGELVGFSSNSMTLAMNFSHPKDLKDFTMTPSTGWKPAIPFTDEEASCSTDPSQRYALWTYTNCVQLTQTRAMHFFKVEKFSSSDGQSATEYGNTMAIYTMDPDTNVITIERPEQYWFKNTTYGYGTFANVVVNNVAYLYGLDTTYSDNFDVHLATVPVGNETNRDYYRYYDAATGEFSSVMPVPTTRRQANAVIQGDEPFSSGTVFWSEYHNAFLLVFFNNYVDSTFRVLSAPSPVGPWNSSSTVLYRSTPGPGGYNYGGMAVPIYYQEPRMVAGQNLLLQYSYQNGSHTYSKILQVTF
ncbi:hypothetical protein POJ06DRAFT_217096 [Lipomyces tetrasporus]|uniref:DUF4185 domain-containing protein n=1 Tax=Lipomyces tetrasporus TaxID=54092 RepID=A0AAD7QY56_9ASCO|nr:uncharacterized protein POJ06DRAFT_217096 [Lipomyces tetrasporus]KAJ8103602.1 hypothetical protein POJ06DRAFT_217096 [Lipomyces tetrasporus]